METILLAEITQSIPKLFIAETLRSAEFAYQEAYTSVQNDPLLDQPERDYLYPHVRRVILEKRLRDVAQASGMEGLVEANLAGNHQFTQIKASRLVMTCSHQNGLDGKMLRSSSFRKQNAELNRLLVQSEFEEGGFEKFYVKDTGAPLNAVIHHGADLSDKSKIGFIRLGFPAVDNDRWAASFDFYEILAAYPTSGIEREADETLIIAWKSKVREANS